ncbi:N-acetylneuraminate synthase family protein [Geothermobacter hydrogeniphilus]|uniref:AFP-like domain-containing protein n=1 Tax=Geothermobacter hydrogeniphilus TaxID=1969733 RepID=A0A1X0YE78_9BACT|nr:N-acetylneuraminate synthase family protein [Geothermobacter hydrogeniphilus]ORJ63490.1 hypothetical protein B5V00_01090 [Geothermobacter hydrogeniphilus]
MSECVSVDGIPIGNGHPCYFMAEIAGNFGNEEEAVRIVDAAVRAGARAIKFQTLDPETITTRSNRFDMEAVGTRLQYEVFAETATPETLQLFLVDYCRRRNITVFSAPSHLKDLDLISRFDSPAYKIGSDLATHIPLLRELATTGKPIFLSTGMCTMAEVETSVNAIQQAGSSPVLLFHCVSNYPGNPAEQNLLAMVAMKEKFGLPTGFSDHTIGIDIARAAIALGADMIERHFWVEGNLEGPDRPISSDEKEFSRLVQSSHYIAAARGNGVKKPTPDELRNMRTNRVSIIVMEDIAAGSLLTAANLDIRRPGDGLPPRMWDEVIGCRAATHLKAEQPLRPEHISRE